jgi:alginate O-acetyltransferase complex protein AlgI
MLFNSYPFIFVFQPLSLIGFYLLQRLGHREAALGYVVACSFVFYIGM